MSQPDATWRVYLAEWMVFYTSDRLEVDGQNECKAHFARKYEGRVRREDMRIRGTGNFRPQKQCLQLWLSNLKGEFKDNDGAWELWGELKRDPAAEVQVVQRGSLQEQVLLDYGTKMLPATGANGGNG